MSRKHPKSPPNQPTSAPADSERPWRIVFDEKQMLEDLRKLGGSVARGVQKAIDERLGKDPVAYGEGTVAGTKGLFKLKVSKVRVIYAMDPVTRTVMIISCEWRKQAYNNPQMLVARHDAMLERLNRIIAAESKDGKPAYQAKAPHRKGSVSRRKIG